MPDDLDTYDVERMIRDAVIRLRSDFDTDLQRLRSDCENDRDDLRDSIAALGRTLDSRTEGLV